MAEKNDYKRTAKILKALGNGHRLQIVQLLQSGEKNVSDINKDVRISQPSLSQHLAKLKSEGVLDSRRDQRQIFYYVSNTHVARLLSVAMELVHTPGSRRSGRNAVPNLVSQFAEMA